MSRGMYLSMPAVVQHIPPTDDTAAAFELGRGRTEAPATDAERRQFEAWMAGHCWACAPWNGSSYTDMATRMLWAAWRDRGALAQPLTDEQIDALMSQAQVFASSWSLVGGRFDDGTQHEQATQEKAELRNMLKTAHKIGGAA